MHAKKLKTEVSESGSAQSSPRNKNIKKAPIATDSAVSDVSESSKIRNLALFLASICMLLLYISFINIDFLSVVFCKKQRSQLLARTHRYNR